MNDCKPQDPTGLPDIPVWCFVLTAFLLVILTPLDGLVVSNMPIDSSERGDFLSLLRILGYLPTWILVSLILSKAIPKTDQRGSASPALAISLTALVSGLIAESLKPFFRRPDPQLGSEGSWQRPPFGDQWWDGTDFCFPSGHSAVAFGAALAICRRWPRTTPWILLAASGCAASRVYERGHHPSDVIASLFIALLASHFLEPAIRKKSDPNCLS